MTVKELKAELDKFPDESNIVVHNSMEPGGGDCYYVKVSKGMWDSEVHVGMDYDKAYANRTGYQGIQGRQ
jgi:hypothetical protein